MPGGDDFIDFGGPGFTHSPPEGNLPCNLEHLPVLEWFVVFEPGVDSLKWEQVIHSPINAELEGTY